MPVTSSYIQSGFDADVNCQPSKSYPAAPLQMHTTDSIAASALCSVLAPKCLAFAPHQKGKQ
jgi:hypothetical protein